jgi:tripartite-type tricarboxylate transporter receptor subunit TctC
MKKILCILLLCSFNVFAKPITIIVPTSSGGSLDMTARIVGQMLNDNNIESVVINVPGAQGDIARDKILSEKNNIIMISSNPFFVFTDLTKNRPNSFINTTKIIGPLVSTPLVFITNPKSFKSFNEFVAYAKENPTPCGVTNSLGQYIMESLNKEYGTKFESVFYKGSPFIIQDLGGDILKCAFDAIGVYIPQHEKGTVKILATTNDNELQIPKITTIFRNFDFKQYHVVLVPNESNLLSDQKFLNTFSNTKKYQYLFQKMIDMGGYIFEKPYINDELHFKIIEKIKPIGTKN